MLLKEQAVFKDEFFKKRKDWCIPKDCLLLNGCILYVFEFLTCRKSACLQIFGGNSEVYWSKGKIKTKIIFANMTGGFSRVQLSYVGTEDKNKNTYLIGEHLQKGVLAISSGLVTPTEMRDMVEHIFYHYERFRRLLHRKTHGHLGISLLQHQNLFRML